MKRLRVARYSPDHRFQKCRTMPWHRCHRRSREIDRYVSATSGMDSSGRPIRKCPGVSASMPSSSEQMGTRGLLLRHASICVKIVVIEFFKCECHICCHTSKVSLQALHCRLPQTTKMGRALRDKAPSDAL